MLNFNLPEGPNRPVWKIFIMDTAGQKILAPLIKVNDLREHGVTLFLQLKGQRERVPDVPAVYFVEPSKESISMIYQDLRANLYDHYYLNFTSHVSRDILEELAQVALQTQTHLKISKVYDQYLNYITLEDNLFTLEIPKVTCNLLKSSLNPNSNENVSIVDTCASGIFSVLMSFGCCAPVICAPNLSSDSSKISTRDDDLVKGICSKLESRIKNHLINTKSPISLSNPQANPNQPRPLMLLIDRRIDLASPLRHSASYNALIDEILGLNSNQIQIPGGKSFDIDRRDWFWRENSIKSFPKVAEAVESALKSYKTEYDRVLQTTPGMTEDLMKTAGATTSESALTPDQLKIAINVLPELTERKRLIDTHLQISTALLESIKTRDLGTLFNIEQEIISASLGTASSNSSFSPLSVLTSLKDPKMGNSQDKLRLLLIYLIYNFKQLTSNNNSFIQDALNVLKLTGDDSKAFQMVLSICGSSSPVASSLLSVTNSVSNSKATSPVNPINPIVSDSSLPTSFGDFFNKISSTTNVLVSSVKNLIPSSSISESPLSKFIDSAYAQVTGTSQNVNSAPSPLHIIDPRPSRGQQVQQQNTHSIDHVIIFMIGGAAYSEYDHLIEHFNRNKALQNVKFTFGVTEILNPKRFLIQLSTTTVTD